MSSSNITEKALAESLKKLMRSYPINKIHVQMITNDCNLTRHTFYNHFQDVYGLLEWIYEHEVIEDLEKCCNLAHWKDGISLVLQYTVENRIICLNTFHSLGRDHLESFLYNVFSHTGIIEDIDITQKINVDEELKSETAEFYADAVVGIFIAWLKQDLKKDPSVIADWIEKIVKGNIVRLMNQYAKK
jgi:probable dihydroxyacetone kinase regulator